MTSLYSYTYSIMYVYEDYSRLDSAGIFVLQYQLFEGRQVGPNTNIHVVSSFAVIVAGVWELSQVCIIIVKVLKTHIGGEGSFNRFGTNLNRERPEQTSIRLYS